MIRERRGVNKTSVLVIRVSWDPDRKRSVQKVVGTFPGYVDAIPASLAGPDSPLTDDEKAEVSSWIARRVAASREIMLPGLGRRVAAAVAELATTLEDPSQAEAALSGLDHLALYDALDRVGKALRKHGKTRPPRTKKAGQAPDPDAGPPLPL